MSTRAAIARPAGGNEGSFTGRYHHWDGYPSGLGAMDILDIAVTHLANDDYNHVPEDELRRRLAHVRSTRIETDLWESADRLIADVRDALRSPGDPEYGGGKQ